jgi:hypothetical protein
VYQVYGWTKLGEVRCGDVEKAFGGVATMLEDAVVDIHQLPFHLIHVLLQLPSDKLAIGSETRFVGSPSDGGQAGDGLRSIRPQVD